MIKARKRFGQHFLEPPWVQKLLDVVRPQPGDTFLEIGPGQGALTLPLAANIARLVAIEIDRDLAAQLTRRVPPNVHVVTADFLQADVRSLLPRTGPIRVVGNLPYNISSPILFRLLALADDGRSVSDATLMLQREVADRIVAPPGGRQYGVLSVLAQASADVTLALALPPGAFRPAPRVSSAVVHFAFRPPPVRLEDRALFVEMVRGMFGQRRKTLSNALKPFAEAHGHSAIEALAKAGVEARRRPETLHLPELAALAAVFTSGHRTDVL